MNVKNVMIGNWLHSKLNDVNAKVCCIECPQYNSVWLDGSENWQRHYMYEVEPIPITDEILKLNGLQLQRESYYSSMDDCDDGKDVVDIEECNDWDKDEVYWSVSISTDNFDCYDIRILYVHELQNILHVLGIEKEIII